MAQLTCYCNCPKPFSLPKRWPCCLATRPIFEARPWHGQVVPIAGYLKCDCDVLTAMLSVLVCFLQNRRVATFGQLTPPFRSLCALVAKPADDSGADPRWTNPTHCRGTGGGGIGA
jgi:hypothetical protein